MTIQKPVETKLVEGKFFTYIYYSTLFGVCIVRSSIKIDKIMKIMKSCQMGLSRRKRKHTSLELNKK